MTAGGRGAGAGVIIGIVVVLLAQQLGLLEFANFTVPIIYFVVGAIAGAIVFGAIGLLIGRQARRKAGMDAWKGAEASAPAPPSEPTPPATPPPPASPPA
jgi:hypothetical protein